MISVRVKMRSDPQTVGIDDDESVPEGLADGEVLQALRHRRKAARADRSAPRGRQFGQAQGSGFFISADGYAVTNNHVVEKADERRGLHR